MASIEALELLLIGGEDWKGYHESTKKVIDLSFADLRDADLRNRVFTDCDLTGALLEGASLDGSSLLRVSLQGSVLAHASLVDVRCEAVGLQDADLHQCVIRDSSLVEVTFSRTRLDSVVLTSSRLESCKLSSIRLDDARISDTAILRSDVRSADCNRLQIERCTVDETTLEEVVFRHASLAQVAFRNCELRAVALKGGEFLRSSIVHSQVDRFESAETAVQDLDLSNSTIKCTALVDLGLPSATLLKTSVVTCSWPDPTGRVGILGTYVASKSLPAHPIQDVQGVPPLTRRTIADAQYLVRLIESFDSRRGRAFLRLWGITCAYGQSIFRLTIIGVIVMAMSALLTLALRGQLVGAHLPDWSLLSRALGNSGTALLGFNPPDVSTAKYWERAVLFADRAFGFIILGLWVSIAARRFGRLAE